MKQHHYEAQITWTGNRGTGTRNYSAYDRAHTVTIEKKVVIHCSSDPQFRGDASKHNPEELLLASLSSCHMLWYLHLCAAAGVVVEEYSDNATGTMEETAEGGGHFTEVVLHPIVVVSESNMIGKANELHHRANELCFIANSCNFPVQHRPTCKAAD